MEHVTGIFYYIKVFIALMILVNPFEGIPLFLSKTNHCTPDEKTAIAKKTSLAVFLVLVLSLFFGRYVLQLFGITIASFSLAGGIIIFLIAIDMVLGKSDSGEKSMPNDPVNNPSDIAIVPLAIPLLAGPGAISSVIVYGSTSTGLVDDLILAVIVLMVGIAVRISLRAASKMEKFLHDTGVKVLTKISGLLVAAIAVEMIFHALIQAFPSLLK
jgi:multiple antibiotic resistance protein